MSHKGRKILLA